jgi:hypothetical protein
MAKSKTTGNGSTAPRTATRARKNPPATRATPPSEEQIRERAYLRYLERGGVHGAADADWFAAEAELLSRQS